MAFPKMPSAKEVKQLLMYESWVPRRVRFWLIVFFALIYQFAGGIYLASLSQMVGDVAVLSEDFTMAGYCTLIGLTMVFPMLFRLKFRFYTRQLFFIASVGLIICNILTMYIEIPCVLWIICFIVGVLKMMGMFGCMTSIQLCITPTRNYGVFFPVVYLLVCGSIQLSGMCTAYVSYFTNWRMMNLVMIAFLGIHAALVYFLMKHDHRSCPYLPLKGVDFVGFALWSLLLVVGTWVFTFGEHYDWWHSDKINIASGLFVMLLAMCIYWSGKCEQPYIALKAFTYPRVVNMMILLLGLGVMQGAAHLLQPIFVTSILHYDALNTISLNLPELIGIIFGALLVYYSLVRWKWSVKQFLFLSFALVTYYAISMYFLIDAGVSKEMMYIPLIAYGIAEVMMEAMATYYLARAVPFIHFFQTIAIIGFIRAGIGNAIGGAIVHSLFSWTMAKNFTNSSEVIDDNLISSGFAPFEQLASLTSVQSLMMAIKECYGYIIFIGMILLIIVLSSNYKTSIVRLVPKVMAVRSWITRSHAKDPTTI